MTNTMATETLEGTIDKRRGRFSKGRQEDLETLATFFEQTAERFVDLAAETRKPATIVDGMFLDLIAHVVRDFHYLSRDIAADTIRADELGYVEATIKHFREDRPDTTPLRRALSDLAEEMERLARAMAEPRQTSGQPGKGN